MHGKRGEQLRLAAGLEAEVKRLARIDNLFDRNGFGEGFVDRFNAVAQQILEAQSHRKR